MRETKQKLVIFFNTQYFNFLDFFTGKVVFLGHDLIFEVFLSILIAFVQKLARSRQIHTTGIFDGQKPYKNHFFVIGNCNFFNQVLTKYSLIMIHWINFSNLSKVSERLTKAHILVMEKGY